MTIGAFKPPGVGILAEPSIRTVQTVLATQTAAALSSTFAFPNLTNFDKCIPFLNLKTNTAGTDYHDKAACSWSINIYNSSGVKADVARSALYGGSTTYDMALTLLEFPVGVTVAKYTLTAQASNASGYFDVPITAVDISKSFILATSQRAASESDGVYGQTIGLCARFTSSTNIRVHCMQQSLAVVPVIILYVVTDPTGACFTVSSTYTTWPGTTRSTNITVPAFVDNKTLAIVNYQANGGSSSYPNVTFVGKHTWNCYPSSNTNFVMATFNGNAGPYTAQCNIQLVTFTNGVTVQRGRVQPAASVFLTNVTIGSVNTSKSAAIGYLQNHVYNGRVEGDTAACPMHQSSHRMRLSSATNLEIERHNLGTPPAVDIGWQVLTTS